MGHPLSPIYNKFVVRFSLRIKVVYEKRWKPHGLMHGKETNADGMIVYDRRSPPPIFQIPPLEESDGSEFWVTPMLDPLQNLFFKWNEEHFRIKYTVWSYIFFWSFRSMHFWILIWVCGEWVYVYDLRSYKLSKCHLLHICTRTHRKSFSRIHLTLMALRHSSRLRPLENFISLHIVDSIY